MATQDTKVKTLVINRMTKSQYDAAVLGPNELALTPDTPATTTELGPVKVDGTTINVAPDGTISAAAAPDLSAYLKNTATGTNALTVAGTSSTTTQSHNIGDSSSAAIYGTSLGYSATSATAGTAIGTRASAGNYGVAIGSANGAGSATTATGASAIAIGYNAKATANTAIQIGTGTNAEEGTVKIKDTQILDANGKIPSANLDTTIPAAQVNSDWNAASGVAQILNKPTIPVVDQSYSATSTNAQSGVAVAEALEHIASVPLFYHTFADHLFNDTSWLRADTFSWQDGTVYSSAYQHLVDDISGIAAQTETIEDTTITFYRAADGHKIVLADQASTVEAIYNATGVAWYYLLDTANTRFKLPRSKWAFTGLRDSVGNYVQESLPNITGMLANVRWSADTSGAFYTTSGTYGTGQGNASNTPYAYVFDASRAHPAYQENAPVRQRATQMYLYFYCGNTVQNQTTIDVGQITETLNSKADTDLSNVTKPYVTETYVNGASWYRVWSDGWCEQGGQKGSFVTTISFLKSFADTNYYFNEKCYRTGSTEAAYNYYTNKSASSITILQNDEPGFWYACGYIS